MKKALLSIAAVGLLSVQGFAQTTFNDTSFTNPVGTTDTFRYISNGYNSSSVPTDGDNMRLERPTGFLWNLQSLAYSLSKTRYINHIPATGYDYANQYIDTLNHKTDTVTNTPKWAFMPEALTKIVANAGIIEYGMNLQETNYSLSTTMIGAAPTDSLWIPAQTVMYFENTIANNPEERVKLKFPATFPTAMWTNSYKDTVHGTLRYAAAGLIDTPFHIKSEVQEIKRITGWGKLRYRKPAYLSTPTPFTDTFEVLQVRCTLQVKDFYYVGDNEVDSTTLSYMGVGGQGEVRLSYYDEFYRRSVVEPTLTIRFTDATFQNSNPGTSDALTRYLNPSKVATVSNLSKVDVYPNPVVNGTVNVDITGAKGNWTYNIININGQQIQEGLLISKGKNTVQLPANTAAGTYFMSLENGEEKIVKPITITE